MRHRLRAAVHRLLDTDVVSQPRYRAWERRHVRTAARAGTAVVIVVLLFDAAAMSGEAPTIAALNVPLALAGLGMLVALTRRSGPRRNPSGAALLLGILALTTSLLPLGLVPGARPILLAYVPLVIVASALFIPWNTARHLVWSGVCIAMVVGFVVSPFGAGMDAHAVDDLITITTDSVAVGLAGHFVLQRQRRGMFLQRMQLRGLNHLAARQSSELRQLAEDLRAAARVDPLTGVANRLRLEEDLEIVAARNTDRTGAALMIDIDRFKAFNDTHGHVAGDRILRTVAAALAANSRPSDRVYRFGGEEFLVLLPGATIIDALAVAERQRAAVEALAIRTERPGRPDEDEVLTISVGVAPMHLDEPSRTAGTADGWLQAADAAMYESKISGRNRVTVRQPDASGQHAVA